MYISSLAYIDPIDVPTAIAVVEAGGGGVVRIGGGAPQTGLPASFTGTTVEYDGPLISVNVYTENAQESKRAKRVWKQQHTGNHIGQSLSGFHIQSKITGSGRNGPSNADVGMSISSLKKSASSGAEYGEIDGIYIVVMQGGPCPTSRNNSSDHAGILIDSSNYGNSGHGFAIESALRNFDSSGNIIYQVQNQMGGIETNWGAFNPDGSLSGAPLGTRYVFGFNSQMVVGTGDVAYLVEGSAKWKSAFRVNAMEADAVFDIRNTGEFWQGSGASRIKHAHHSGSSILTTGFDVTFATFSPASGIIAGDYANADGLRIQGGALGTQARVEALSAGANSGLHLLAKGTGGITIGRHTNTIGFYGSFGVGKPTVTGSKGGNAALASLLSHLAAQNLITDSTSD